MANVPRNRKRVHALRRAADGSAFEKCDVCGVLVAIALSDMHECKYKRENKRFKGAGGYQNPKILSVHDQPRSPFCIFMESFKKSHKYDDWIELGRRGFETWRNMSTEERGHFVIQAEKVNSAYQKVLLKEVEDAWEEEDDEANSPNGEKFNLDYGYYKDWDSSESSEIPLDRRFESFDSDEWNMVSSWIAG